LDYRYQGGVVRITAFDKDQLEVVGDAINPNYEITERKIDDLTLYEMTFCLTTHAALKRQLLAELAKHDWNYLKVEI
jgi:hypothetical protein